MLGAVLAWRGRGDEARRLLIRCLETATRLDVVSMLCDSAAALAWLADAEGDRDRAHELCRLVLDRWSRSEDHHYAVWGLRWAASWLARNGEAADARACAEALSAIAASAGHHDALAALAHALGEIALAEGDAAAARRSSSSRAVELHEGLDIPFERAQILLRRRRRAGGRRRARDRARAARRRPIASAGMLGAAPLAADGRRGGRRARRVARRPARPARRRRPRAAAASRAASSR